MADTPARAAWRALVAHAERALRFAEAGRRSAEDEVRDAREDVREARALLDAALAIEVPRG